MVLICPFNGDSILSQFFPPIEQFKVNFVLGRPRADCHSRTEASQHPDPYCPHLPCLENTAFMLPGPQVFPVILCSTALLADGQQTWDLKKQPITLASQTEFGSQKQQLLSVRLEQQTWLQEPPALTLQGQHTCKPFSHTEELGNSGLVRYFEGFR